jgi:hypothetical protein
MTEQGLEHLRSTVQGVVDRIRTEEGFADILKKDTVGTLIAAGVDKDLAAYIAREELSGKPAEVSGYRRCDRYTCWVSWCGDISIGGTN